MTTDPTTPEGLLAEALHSAEVGCWPNVDNCLTAESHRGDALDILAHPALARALAIGAAWLDAGGDEVLALAAGATPGPWGRRGWDVNAPTGEVAGASDGFLREDDIRFAVAAANLLLALADALRKERGA